MISKKYSKYGWILTVSLIVLWIILTPSHFQKGGVGNAFYFAIAIFITLISLLIALLFDKFKLLESIIISFPFAFISLFLMTFIIGPKITDVFYGDKTWLLCETKDRIFINTFYYGLNAIFLIMMNMIYFKIKTTINLY